MANESKKNVPVLILAGGMGTRISEETHLRPKPMIEIGDVPILVHIMRWYYSFGFDDFVICAGYRSWEIKSYFLNYEFRMNHLAIDHRTSADQAARAMGRNMAQEKWRIRVVDTGLEAMTGARVARAFDSIVAEGDRFDEFAVTYGDGLADADLGKELEFHRAHGRLGTVLGVVPTARWGELDVNAEGKVQGFLEKPESKQALVNGGFFFMKKAFREYLKDEDSC
ncbi:MAG TPA: sugar phosphate nucleotidyltransferase, partial [Bdellovibrionota bacterium]|nr:sugar phosphate nucleotidyltransferase [Bdellovibrionota bacterium]